MDLLTLVRLPRAGAGTDERRPGDLTDRDAAHVIGAGLGVGRASCLGRAGGSDE